MQSAADELPRGRLRAEPGAQGAKPLRATLFALAAHRAARRLLRRARDGASNRAGRREQRRAALGPRLAAKLASSGAARGCGAALRGRAGRCADESAATAQPAAADVAVPGLLERLPDWHENHDAADAERSADHAG